MQKALWIKGYENLYKILPTGEIISFKQNKNEGKILCPRLSGSGYMMVTLINKSGKQKQCYVHKIVAQHYLINPNKRKLKIIGFKDGNPKNIHITNLFWTDTSGRASQYFKNKNRQLKKDGMITSSISREQLYEMAKLMNVSTARNKQEFISKLFSIHRMTFYRIRKTNLFKRALKETKKQT